MNYSDLYQWVQTYDKRVSTKLIREKIIEKNVVTRIEEFWHPFNTNNIRAAFLRGPLTLGPFDLADESECLFAVARNVGKDKKERRVTICKELMHVFDDANERAVSSKDIDDLLSFLTQTSSTYGAIAATEPRALVRALGAIVPESLRIQIASESSSKSLYDMSAELGVPERHVGILLRDDFKDLLKLP